MRLTTFCILATSAVAWIIIPSLHAASSLPGTASKGIQSQIPSPTDADKQKQQQQEIKKQKEQRAIRHQLENKVKQLEGKGGKSFQETLSDAFSQQGNEYAYPGVVVLRNNSWQGSDNIYNIAKNIAVGVDISVASAEGPPFPVKEETIRARVAAIFQDAGITPSANNNSGASSPLAADSGGVTGYAEQNVKAPLPLFMVVLIVQPINKGYAVYCAANLFEEVDVKRVRLDEGVWQAITWERQHLVVGSTEEIPYHISRCVDDLAYSFVKLYRYFENVRPAR